MRPNIFDREFQKWAFGGIIPILDIIMMDQWNALHGDILNLTKKEFSYECFPIMWDLWLKHQEKDDTPEP